MYISANLFSINNNSAEFTFLHVRNMLKRRIDI